MLYAHGSDLCRDVVMRHAMANCFEALMGALFLIAADVVSRIAVPGQVLPIGVVTALVGAPVFAVILIRRRPAR